MAKTQYRIWTETQWMSQSGVAILAVLNKSNSGKKILIPSIEIFNNTIVHGGAAGVSNVTQLDCVRAVASTVTTGTMWDVEPLDTAASSWPSTVKVMSNCSVTPTETFYRFMLRKEMNAGWPHNNFGELRNGSTGTVWRSSSNTGTVTRIIVRAGEQVSLVTNAQFYVGAPLLVTATLVRQGSPNRTYIANGFVNATYSANQCILSISNDSGSGEIIELLNLAIAEVGTFDTPYFQLVPIGQIDASSLTDNTRKLNSAAIPTDTDFGSLSTSVAEVYSNVPIFPSGVPVEYLAGSSAGTPKGFNYLNTKDFLGPTYLNYLPEQCAGATSQATASSNLNSNRAMKYATLKGPGAAIVLRPGEGFAIVSGAETATGTTPVGISGWMTFEFGMTMVLDNAFSPSLNLTGLKSGSEVRIFDAGTTTELAGSESTGTTFSWEYDYTLYSSIDIVVHHVSYEYVRLEGISIDQNGVTIPIQQRTDRQYLNS